MKKNLKSFKKSWKKSKIKSPKKSFKISRSPQNLNSGDKIQSPFFNANCEQKYNQKVKIQQPNFESEDYKEEYPRNSVSKVQNRKIMNKSNIATQKIKSKWIKLTFRIWKRNWND